MYTARYAERLVKNALLVLALALLLAGLWDRNSPEVNAALVQEASERKAVLPEDYAWYRRHERQSRACRGQQYISQCCEHAREDVTCLDLKGPQ
jgi:hypothetical protein